MATQWALRVFDEAGRLDHPAVVEAAEWCGTVLTPEGGLPFCLPNVDGWPRAPWWNPEGDPNPPNPVPTAGVVATLRKAGLSLTKLHDLLESGQIVPLDPDAESGPDTHMPLKIVQSPEHPLRPALKDDVVEVFLDRIEKEQLGDGGWPVDWPAPGETAIGNWRAIKTIEAITILRNYGRL